MTDDPSAALTSPLDAKLGFQLHELSPRHVVGSIPVAGNEQPFGLLHGGASAVLVETLGSLGALQHARSLGRRAVGVDLNITHLSAARTGRITGTATALHLGTGLATYHVELVAEDSRLTAVGRITLKLIEA